MLISLSCWGGWHTEVFKRYGLPNLLAPGNLPGIEHRLIVHTRHEDQAQIRALVPAGTEVVPDVDGYLRRGCSPRITQAHIWREDFQRARRLGTSIALIWPDVAWSAGTFARYAALMAEGYGAVYQHFPRFDAGAAVLLDGVTDPRRMASAFLAAGEHRISQLHRADSRDYPEHAELVTWRCEAGLLARMTAASPTVINTRPAELDGNLLLAPAPHRVYVIRDSDEALGLSLTPSTHEASWGGGRHLTADHLRAWLSGYPSPHGEILARSSYRLHDRDTDEADWAHVEERAGVLMDRVLGPRWSAAA